MINEIYTESGWLTADAISQGLAHTQYNGRVQFRAKKDVPGKYEVQINCDFAVERRIKTPLNPQAEMIEDETNVTFVFEDFIEAKQYFADVCDELECKFNRKLNRYLIL